MGLGRRELRQRKLFMYTVGSRFGRTRNRHRGIPARLPFPPNRPTPCPLQATSRRRRRTQIRTSFMLKPSTSASPRRGRRACAPQGGQHCPSGPTRPVPFTLGYPPRRRGGAALGDLPSPASRAGPSRRRAMGPETALGPETVMGPET
eukprot:scaffold4389_cov92-Isochrysis_galbana.AAC.3